MTTYTRINKTRARNLVNKGSKVYAMPRLMRTGNGWQVPALIELDEFTSFDTWVNRFEYYNCSYETGYYSAFYIKESEQ